MPIPFPTSPGDSSIGDLGGAALANGTAEDLTYDPVGSYKRGADFKLHADVGALKRGWSIKCELITEAQFNALNDVYTGALGGAIALTLNSVGSSIFVMVSDWKAPRARGNRRTLTFTAKEV